MYEEPGTGKPINIGVQAWMEYKDTLAFVERMGVSTNGSMQFANLTSRYIDFETGRAVPGYEPPADADKFAALQRYLEVCERYEDMLLPGFMAARFPAPAEIPEDLLLPFHRFVAKYDIAAAVPQMWQATAMGLGATMDVPTLYVMQAVGVPMVRALLGQAAAAVPPSGRLQDLYDRVADFLGPDDVLYSSTVAAADRTPDGVVVDVVAADGTTTTRIQARRLLVAIEPTARNMAPFAPDAVETEVFDKLQYTTVYAGLLRHPTLAADTSYAHTVPAAAPRNWTVFPLPAQLGRIDHVGGSADLFEFTAVGTDGDTAEGMQALIGRAIDAMRAAGTTRAAPAGTLSFPAFADHGPVHARVTADNLRAGFIQKQVALQGRRSTWYTGAAFGSGFSTVLWAYNEALLPQVIEGL